MLRQYYHVTVIPVYVIIPSDAVETQAPSDRHVARPRGNPLEQRLRRGRGHDRIVGPRRRISSAAEVKISRG